jgi:DNA invertase Pin-like site-specific DNA recombinase
MAEIERHHHPAAVIDHKGALPKISSAERFVAYYRVSTAQQGHSGLGLEAQREAVRVFLSATTGTLAEEFTEIESGKDADRPQLARALDACRLTGAVLVIAKLDRLSRDAHFLLGLEKAGVEFVAADMPNANRLTVRLMAVIAQGEREMISARTKAALAAAKARGQQLGGNRGGPKVDPASGRAARTRSADDYARQVGPIALAAWREVTEPTGGYDHAASVLTNRGIRTPRGGKWTRAAVRSVILRHTAQLPKPAEIQAPQLMPVPPAQPIKPEPVKMHWGNLAEPQVGSVFVTARKGFCYLTVKNGRRNFEIMRIRNYTIDADDKRRMRRLYPERIFDWKKITRQLAEKREVCRSYRSRRRTSGTTRRAHDDEPSWAVFEPGTGTIYVNAVPSSAQGAGALLDAILEIDRGVNATPSLPAPRREAEQPSLALANKNRPKRR